MISAGTLSNTDLGENTKYKNHYHFTRETFLKEKQLKLKIRQMCAKLTKHFGHLGCSFKAYEVVLHKER